MDINIETARDNMIQRQLRTWDVLDETVLEVFASISREHFVPERYRYIAFANSSSARVRSGHDAA